MKTIGIIFVLAMFSFTGGVSAATLTWTSTPDKATLTDVGGSTISAQFGFGHKNTDFEHTYKFTSSSADVNTVALYNELPHEGISLSTIVFDGVMMLFDTANQRWQGEGARSSEHVIILKGRNLVEGSQYNLTASASNVPLPAAVWFFASGIAGLIGFRRRQTAM